MEKCGIVGTVENCGELWGMEWNCGESCGIVEIVKNGVECCRTVWNCVE